MRATIKFDLTRSRNVHPLSRRKHGVVVDLTFSVKYGSGEERFSSLDGYYGAQSLLGITQILLISLNAYINRDIITQATSAKGFRLSLGVSRRGSWEQIIHFLITDPHLQSTVEDLGKNALYDLLKWGLCTGVGTTYVLKYNKSKKVVKELRKQNDDLQDKLDEALRRAHLPIKNQGLSIHIKSNKTELVQFDRKTLDYLETEIIDNEQYAIDVCISRFNARTGTGRMISAIDSESVPFYPESELSEKRKALLADNLALVARGNFEPITAYVSKVTSSDGRLKRYTLHGATSKV